MAPQATKKCGLLFPDHPHIGCCTSNGIDSEQVPGTVFALGSPSLTFFVFFGSAFSFSLLGLE